MNISTQFTKINCSLNYNSHMWAVIENWCPCPWWLKAAPKPEKEEKKKKSSSRLPQPPSCALHDERVHTCQSADWRTSNAGVKDLPLLGNVQYPESEKVLYANQHAATPSMKQGGRPDNNETPDLLLPSTPYLRSLVSEDNILHNGYQTPMNSKEEHNGVHHGSSGLNVAMCTPDATVEKFLVGGYDVRQIVGFANTTRRYNPAQRIPVHQTPFEKRMEEEILREKGAMRVVQRRPRDSQGN